jgi:hypothetical protein
MQTTPRAVSLLPGKFAICRLKPDHPIPQWADFSPADFSSVTRTRDELSIICPAGRVPSEVTTHRGWRCLRVEGSSDLLEAGILAAVIEPLAGAGVSAIAVATHDTDYILIHDPVTALQALAKAGHMVTSPSDGQ